MQQPESVVRNISQANERIEMTVNTSQILTLGTRIPRLVVNNPELVTATPISETQVQIAARKPGVTQINLWDENGKIYTVDLLDLRRRPRAGARAQADVPASSIKVIAAHQQPGARRPGRPAGSRQHDLAPGRRLRPEGRQQHHRRRRAAGDAQSQGHGSLAHQAAAAWASTSPCSATMASLSRACRTSFSQSRSTAGTVTSPAAQTIDFGVIGNDTTFFGFLDCLAAEQRLEGAGRPDARDASAAARPASSSAASCRSSCRSGLGQTTIEYKDFGTQVDFVPIVLGNGRIRLEVRPRLSEIDDSRSVTVNAFVVPALKVRQVDTGVEMNAGQTLALAGLIQERIESANRGLPYVMDLPFVGVPFRKVQEAGQRDRTPDPRDARLRRRAWIRSEVPPCGPGMETMSPSQRRAVLARA